MGSTSKKKAQPVHLSYAGIFSNNPYADSFQAILEPRFGIYLDLSRNLRTRSKQSNSYTDAMELAQGKIEKLELLQIHDGCVLDDLARYAPQPLPNYLASSGT